MSHKVNKFYKCPYPNCGVDNLTENDLWYHCPLYHIGARNRVAVECSVCGLKCGQKRPFQVHLHHNHGLRTDQDCVTELKHDRPSFNFAFVIVRRKSDQKFLLVHQFASIGFWLPGGKVDPGETLESAAIRECEEEAGVRVKLLGIVKIEHTAHRFENSYFQHNPSKDYNRLRVFYYAEPVDIDESKEEQKESLEVKEENNETTHALLAKSIPNYDSLGACWIEVDELKSIKLRGEEPNEYIPYVAGGGAIYPLDILSTSLMKHVY